MKDIYSIVRCNSSQTLPLARELFALGVRAWAPRWRRRIRLPRSKKTRVVTLPLLPTFVFIDARDIQEALYLTRSFQVPPFSPLIICGEPATVDLSALLLIGEPEKDALPPPTHDDIQFTPGERIEIVRGPFEGRLGIVDSPRSGYFRVQLEKSGLFVDVPSFLLRKVAI